MGKKEARRLLSIAKEARKSALMDNADFSEELKEETRLYRNTWIVHPLDQIIAALETHV